MARKEVLKGYGGFVRIPYAWLKMCKKYLIVNQEGIEQKITINLNEIFLLARIAGWNDQGKDCTETNNSLAEILNVSVDTIKKYIKELRLVGLIKTYEEKDTPIHTSQRTIYIQYDVIDKILGMNVPSKEEDENELGTNVPSGGYEHTQSEGTYIPSSGYEYTPNKNNKINNNSYNNKEEHQNIEEEENKESELNDDLIDKYLHKVKELFKPGSKIIEIAEKLNLTYNQVSSMIDYGKKYDWKTPKEREAEQKRSDEKLDRIASSFDETPEEYKKKVDLIWEERRKENERKAEEERKKQEERERKILEEVGIY